MPFLSLNVVHDYHVFVDVHCIVPVLLCFCVLALIVASSPDTNGYAGCSEVKDAFLRGLEPLQQCVIIFSVLQHLLMHF